MKTIAVYMGEGARGGALLKNLMGETDLPICSVNAHRILDQGALDGAIALILPGGYDLPYVRDLSEAAPLIRHFVCGGGKFLGLCAGAYFACQTLCYRESACDEIAGERPLHFFEACARGPLRGLYDRTLRTASVVNLGERGRALYHGGPWFDLAPSFSGEVLARYHDLEGAPPAVLECSFGQGKAIACGVHPEVSARDVEEEAWFSESPQEHTPLIKAAQEAEVRRRAFWRFLLGRLGLL